MTVDEIERAKAEGRAVDSGPLNYDGPQLLIIWPKRLNPQAIINLKDALSRMGSEGLRVAVFEENPRVFQLIDGQWQELA